MSPATITYAMLYERFKEQDRQRAMFGTATLPDAVDPATIVKALQPADTPAVETPKADEANVEPSA